MQSGEIIGGRYQIIAPLGEGGMANVYRAFDIILGREVALKIMRLDLSDDPIVQRRFENEIRASTELVNPHITQVYDYGDENGTQYLVTEYVAGTDLKRYELANYPLALTKVVNIMSQILEGVQAAHDEKIIHRDLKPQNILMALDGTAKITDFGIARAQSSYGMTQTNTAIGSVHYMAPEQVRGDRATPQSDIYSLGIMLFEMLTGHVPYDGETSVAVAVKHTTEKMPSVRGRDPRIPQALENVVMKATAKNPLDRYSSADEMRADLATALAPERLTEAKWVAPHELEDDEKTKVLPIKHANQVDHGMQKQMTTTVATQAKQSAVKGNQEVPPAQVKQKHDLRKKRFRRFGLGILITLLALLVGFVVYGALQPNKITVPDLRNESLTSVKAELKEDHLTLGQVKRVYSDDVKTGHVISSSPKAGKVVKQAAKIDLVISKGSKKVRFGDYTNENYDTVSEQLRTKGYSVTTRRQASGNVPAGYIIDQNIDPNKLVVPAKTAVIFTISTGPAYRVPNITKSSSSQQSSSVKASEDQSSTSSEKANQDKNEDGAVTDSSKPTDSQAESTNPTSPSEDSDKSNPQGH